MFWIYTLRCADNTYYTGHTDGLPKRLEQHKRSVFDGYTSRPSFAQPWRQIGLNKPKSTSMASFPFSSRYSRLRRLTRAERRFLLPDIGRTVFWQGLVLGFWLCVNASPSLQITGNTILSIEQISDLAKPEIDNHLDSLGIQRMLLQLDRTDLFDALSAHQDSTGDVVLSVREKRRHSLLAPGAGIHGRMFAEGKLWFYLRPGFAKRFISDRPHTLNMWWTFPYQYGLLAEWKAHSLPRPGYASGLCVGAITYPHLYARYHSSKTFGCFDMQRRIGSRYAVGINFAMEGASTYLIDVKAWKKLDQQIVLFHPYELRDTSAGYHLENELAPSVALRAGYDRRNASWDPTRGMWALAEVRHSWISSREIDYRFNLTEIDMRLRSYSSMGKSWVGVVQAKTLIRTEFDNQHLRHRLIYHDYDEHFRGYRLLCGQNLAFVNLEERYRLLRIERLGISLPWKFHRLDPKLVGSLYLLGFADAGLMWGHTYLGQWEQVGLNTTLAKDRTLGSLGLGLRLVLEKFGQVATAGLIPFHWGMALPDEHRTVWYASLSFTF